MEELTRNPCLSAVLAVVHAVWCAFMHCCLCRISEVQATVRERPPDVRVRGCQDMHPEWEVEEVRRMASGTLQIRAAEGNTPQRHADGTLVLSMKRRTGGSPGIAGQRMHEHACLPLSAVREAGREASLQNLLLQVV